MFEANLRLDNIGVGSSFIHKIHPLAKVLVAILGILLNALISSMIVSLCLASIFFLLIILSGLSLKTFLKAYAFILLTVVGLIISYLILIGLTLETSITIWLNMSALGLPIIFLMFTSPILNSLYGIEVLLSPLKKIKVPVNAIVLICTIALSFIPIVLTEMQRILNSMAVRGRDIRFAPFKDKIKIFIIALIPLLISTLRSTETLANSIAVKNYDTWNPRTNILSQAWKFSDTIFLLMMLVMYISMYIGIKT